MFMALALITVTMFMARLSPMQTQESLPECPLGSRSCPAGSGFCLHRRYWCDGIVHCDEGEDEDFSTCDHKDAIMDEFVTKHVPLLALNDTRCGLSGYPTVCHCEHHDRLFCLEKSLKVIPKGIQGSLQLLSLGGNLITVKQQDFETDVFSNLRSLYLDRNHLKEIPVGSFLGLRHLTLLSLEDNQLETLAAETFTGMPSVSYIFLDNNQLVDITPGVFASLEHLIWLRLSNNRLEAAEDSTWELPPNLIWLSVDNNNISVVGPGLLRKTPSLSVLYLQGNRISVVSPMAFEHLPQLRDLYLSENQILHLDGRTFSHNPFLVTLSLANNPLTTLSMTLFDGLELLESLDMRNIDIDNINETIFQPLHKLKFIRFQRFEYCAFAPLALTCEPRGDGISSFYNLLDLTVLQVAVWVMAIVTCLGNGLVLAGRYITKENNMTYSVPIKNLAASDFLMSVYLAVIGVQDIRFRGAYNRNALSWIRSWGCKATGLLALISSEVSVLLITYISLDRFICIASPLVKRRLGNGRVVVVGWWLAAVWGGGLLLCLLPLVSQDTFGPFYGTNGVCLPLHLQPPYAKGWRYSAVLLIGVNSLAFVLVVGAYVGIALSVWRTQNSTTLDLNKDLSFIKRILLIVVTDALCWTPIVTIKILALCSVHISEESYAWVTVFVLPINSALNPLFYTLTAPRFLQTLRERQKAMARNRRLRLDSCVSKTSGQTPRRSSSEIRQVALPSTITGRDASPPDGTAAWCRDAHHDVIEEHRDVRPATSYIRLPTADSEISGTVRST